jgi:beta-glucosidase
VSGRRDEGIAEAVEAARKADVVIAVMGERSGLSRDDVSGEGRDRTNLDLPGIQEDLLRAVHRTGKPIVAVLLNGRPLTSRWMVENCPAILEAWLPGEEGGTAVADVIFGDYSPGGRLPVSVPQAVGQTPLNYNRKPSSYGQYVFAESKPVFPFGHGLSYTKFEYRALDISPREIGPAGQLCVSLTVKNAGKKMGDEVVQLYIRDEVASLSRPVMELKGFKRINLKPGEKRRVTFYLPTDLLAFHDRDMNRIVEPGRFRVLIGRSSEDILLKGHFTILGDTKSVPQHRHFFSRVEVS